MKSEGMNQCLAVPFVIGQTYWLPVVNPQPVRVPCPVCYGQKAVMVILGNGEHVTVACEGCNVQGPEGTIQEYSYEPGTKPFTVTGVESMHGGNWSVKSAEGDTANWNDLRDTHEAAMEASAQFMASLIEDNRRRATALNDSALKRTTWLVRYHEKCIWELEQRLSWHRAKVAERNKVAHAD